MGDDTITFGEVDNGLRAPSIIALEMGLDTTDNPELSRMYETIKELFRVHVEFSIETADDVGRSRDTKISELDDNTISPSQIRAYFNTVGVSPDKLNELADLLESNTALKHQPEGRDLSQQAKIVRDFHSKLTSEV